ncbi:peptidylprolyl isomerase [Alphaproteobacteria bacterium]|nr:peptidylprolyl isomerase [Alphaproteobacteria bacterium]
MVNSETKQNGISITAALNRLSSGCMALVIVILIAMSPALANAQQNQVLRIHAVVNDDVISFYDLIQRIRLLILTSSIEDSLETRRRIAPQVLRSMIDEKLRLQEAERLNIKISSSLVDARIGFLEEQNKMPAGALTRILDQAGIALNSLQNKIRAEIAWQRIVQRRLVREVSISDDQVEEELARLKSIQHLPQYQVSEIYLSVDNPDQEQQVVEVAKRLIGQLDAGAKFSILAREFSQSASAAVGGDLGIVSKGQLDSEIEEVIEGLSPGETAGPIRTLSGFYILKLHNRLIPAQATAAADKSAQISQVLLPLKLNAVPAEIQAQERIAQRIKSESKSCKQLEETGKKLNTPQSGSLGDVKIATLPDSIRKAIDTIPENTVTPPIRVAEGLLLLMVCKWLTKNPGLPVQKDIRGRLANKRLDLLMQRYMRNLRRTAFIDVRG